MLVSGLIHMTSIVMCIQLYSTNFIVIIYHQSNDIAETKHSADSLYQFFVSYFHVDKCRVGVLGILMDALARS